MLDGGRRRGERSARHHERSARRRIAWWITAGAAWLVVTGLLLAALDVPPVDAWPTGHRLRTAVLELDARWAEAVNEAAANGLGLVRLEPDHVAAWLNRLVEADPADPAISVALKQGTAEVRYRLRGRFGIRPVLTLSIRPSLLGSELFLALDRASLGRCPLPLTLWRIAVQRAAGESGWAVRNGAVGYEWPVEVTVGASPVEIGGITCAEGVLEVSLCAVRQTVDAGR